ncbi:hypothetical protein [Bacillus taeanensis]|uniref:Peptidase M50 domain-containing protein n=1 Tax=Bacillus taeanensis TaxID=273032 RepID=A0A366XYK8_9BACI|nr:hypothetical protein [Bacillus taeanensis]RBW69839.1 hypothetical protein DS031_09940 [Bacillus taeanensis]
MFGWHDMWTFFWSLFIVLPLVSFLHQAGHVFFAKLFGAEIKFALGRGKVLFKFGAFEIRRIYFLDSTCHYEGVRVNSCWAHILIYAGGTLFNALSVLIVNSLIVYEILPSHLFFYQFAYFSIYFTFFALLPVQYGENHPSDAKAIYDVIRYNKPCDPID